MEYNMTVCVLQEGEVFLYARKAMRKLIILVLAAIILAGLTGCHNWHYSSNIGFGIGHGYGYDYGHDYGYTNYYGGHHRGHGSHHGNHH